MTRFQKLSLVADIPQQINGRFSAIRVLDGAYHAYWMFDKNPGTAGDTSEARRLNRNGLLIVGPIEDPWFLSKGFTVTSTARQLHLEFYTGAAAMIETQDHDLIYEHIVANQNAFTVTGSSESVIATNGFDLGGLATGYHEMHHRGVFSGFVRATGAFELQLRVKDLAGNASILAAVKSNNHSTYHSISLDMAKWDSAWQASFPATWAGLTSVQPRLPVGVQSQIVFIEKSGLSNDFTAAISIRSR